MASLDGSNSLMAPLIDQSFDYSLNESRIQNHLNFSKIGGEKTVLDDPQAAKAGAGKEEEEFPNNTDRSIDFDRELKILKKRTEIDIPYVQSQCEDAMYIDAHTVVTLEYHYYQNDCQYSQIAVVDEHLNSENEFVDSEGTKKEPYALGTDQYQFDLEKEFNNNSHFERADIRNLVDTNSDLLKRERTDENSTCTKVVDAANYPYSSDNTPNQNAQSDFVVEGIIAQYKISNTGNMQRINECPLKMGRNYTPSRNGNMMMVRSRDKSKITIVNFDRKHPDGKYFKILAFSTKLKPIPLQEDITKDLDPQNKSNQIIGLNQYFQSVKEKKGVEFDELIEISVVGQSKYVQMVYMESVQRELEEQQDYEKEIHRDFAIKMAASKRPAINKAMYKRSEPRKARKYAYFDIETGE